MGYVTEGFAVSVFGLPALLPFDLIDDRLWSELANSTIDVKLLEVDKSRNYILLIKQIDKGSGFNEEDEGNSSEFEVGDEV